MERRWSRIRCSNLSSAACSVALISRPDGQGNTWAEARIIDGRYEFRKQTAYKTLDVDQAEELLGKKKAARRVSVLRLAAATRARRDSHLGVPARVSDSCWLGKKAITMRRMQPQRCCSARRRTA